MNLPCSIGRFHNDFTSLHFTCCLVHSELAFDNVLSFTQASLLSMRSSMVLANLDSITQQCEMLAFIQSDSITRSSAFQPPSG